MGLPLIKPKEISIVDGEGQTRSVIISKFDAVEGLEIQLMFPPSLAMAAIPKVGGDFKIPLELIHKIMNYVAIDIKGQQLRLSTPQLINNHLGDWEALLKVIWEVMQYNSSFIRNGTLSDFLTGVVRNTLAKISETFTQSSASSSAPESPPSMNSAQSTV